MTNPVPHGWLVPGPPQLLEARDQFVTTAENAPMPVASVADFWTWAFSDLRDNALRGVLAEFIVGFALGATGVRRKAWDNYDLVGPEGVRVEVKASGYLQAWPQAKHFRPSFGRVAARSWDANTNSYGPEAEVRADVFVFAVQTCRDHEQYDALNVDQWEFYVITSDVVREAGVKTLGIGWVRNHAEPVSFSHLATAVRSVSLRGRGTSRGSR